MRNEPATPLPANDDAAPAIGSMARNGPEPPARPAPETLWLLDGVPLLDAWGRPRRLPAAVP